VSSGRSKANRKKLQNEEFREDFHQLENGQFPENNRHALRVGLDPGEV
jgi:hypothetical protein